MELPVLDGVIDRRMLINYRVRPEALKGILPAQLEPLVINGYASAGICLLRLKDIGIKHFPSFGRITSENAAHRFLVQAEKNGKRFDAVYIPRRDTDSLLNVWVAGTMFSWPHWRASFASKEGNGHYKLTMRSEDQTMSVKVHAVKTTNFPGNSMFDSMAHASACFKNCSIGVSPSRSANRFKTIELKTNGWRVTPLVIEELHSSFFENQNIFPVGTIHFDNALLMEGIEHEWHSHTSI
jgi:hypothetical protein